MDRGVRARILVAWITWALARPYQVLGVACLLTVASVVVTFQSLDFQTSQHALISPRDPLITLTKRLDPFQKKDTMTVVIQAPTPPRAVAFLTALAQRLEGDAAHFREVFYRVAPAAVRPWALFYLKPPALQHMQERLDTYPTLLEGLAQQPDLTAFLRLVNQEMASRMVGALFTDFLKDAPAADGTAKGAPMDLSFLIQTLDDMAGFLEGRPLYHSPWASFFEEGTWDRELAGYFWVAEKQLLLLFVTPRQDKTTFNRAQAALEHLRQVIATIRRDFPDVQAGVTGQDALKTDEMTVALRDMSWATWLAMAGVWLFNVLFFRSQYRTLVRMIVLAIGMCWTFGWLTLAVGSLNILSMVFAPMLVGLGDDYAVHWFARMEEEERRAGRSRRAVILQVTAQAGPGILTAGLSGALTFLPLILTGFQGLVELGAIAGMGLMFQLVADFTVLPVLSLFGKSPQASGVASAPSEDRDLLRLNHRAVRWVIGGAAVLSLVSLWGASSVRFDLNPLHMQARGTESVFWEETLRGHAQRSVLFASTVVETLEALETTAQALKQLPTVHTVVHVLSILPEEQDSKVPLVHAVGARIPSVPAITGAGTPPDPAALIDLLQRIRFKMDDAEADQWGASRPVIAQLSRVRSLTEVLLTALQTAPDRLQGLTAYQEQFRADLADVFDLLAHGAHARPMTVADIPATTRERFQAGESYLMRIYPTEDVWEAAPRDRFVRAIRTVDPKVAGDAVTLHVYTDAFRRASLQASGYAVLAIGVLLLMEFRNIRLAGLALIPLLLGTLWTVGAMGFLHVPFNLANSLFFPLIVGCGAEYGIILLHRWQEGRMLRGHLPVSTGKGVMCAALTTTLGFGTFMICRHQGIFTLGVASFAGSLLVMLTALVLLPALLPARSARHPEDREGGAVRGHPQVWPPVSEP